MKTFVIGDIHGCSRELLDLLDKAGLSSDDEIIALGDILDRGPDSPDVLNFFMAHPNARSLMGNHERKHVRSFRGEIRPALSQRITRRQFGEERYPQVCAYLDRFPRFLELPNAILAHAFFEPGVQLSAQRETVVVGTLSGEAYLKERFSQPWYELYDGDKPLIVGHHDHLATGQPFIYRDRVFCIDTGCCNGRTLTGLMVPDFHIISVPSRKDYWKEMQNQHADLRYTTTPDKSLAWDRIEILLTSARMQPSLPPEIHERILRLESLVAKAEKVLADLFKHIMDQNERILAELQKQVAFDALSSREQFMTYTAHIGQTPLSRFLYLARKGKLTLEYLRRHFQKPKEVMEFAAQIGLPMSE